MKNKWVSAPVTVEERAGGVRLAVGQQEIRMTSVEARRLAAHLMKYATAAEAQLRETS